MSKKTEISWLTKGQYTPSASVGALVKSLEGQHYSVSWKNLASDPTLPTGFDWSTVLSSQTRCVILNDKDLEWVKQVASSLRKLELPDRPTFTICWTSEEINGESLAVLLGSDVDDIFSYKEPTKEISARLQLRLQQVEEKLKLQVLLKERSSSEAKSEITMKQREEFLSVCAHDLRSPLGLIQSSLGMLLNGKLEIPEFQVELLTRAKRQAGQAITLVNDLLDVMSFEQGLKPQYKLLRLDDLLQEFYRDYSFQSEQKKIQFHYENSVKDWRVLADADRIRQLLQNLFMNALKFTESNKNIFLNVMSFQGRRKADPPYPMIVVSLKDEGRGIPQKEMQKIFDRFTQIKDYSRAEGRGLGLTVAKQISTLHDGNIWVQSIEGEGSTFFVLFPHVISRSKAEDSKVPKKKVIIAVAPEEKDRAKYYEILGRWGYEVHFAKDGIEAVTYAYHFLPEAILLTQDMSKLTEYEVFSTLRNDKLTQNMPVLCTSEAKLVVKDDSNEPFYDEYLKLPFTRESFQIALDSATRKLQKPKKKAA